MNKTTVSYILVFCVTLLAAGCGQQSLLDKMKATVPVIEGGTISESYSPTEGITVIKFKVDAATASKKDIMNFYEQTMTGKGWELKSSKDYGKNGSVMEFFSADSGTLSVQPITKHTDETGKIPVVLSLSWE